MGPQASNLIPIQSSSRFTKTETQYLNYCDAEKQQPKRPSKRQSVLLKVDHPCACGFLCLSLLAFCLNNLILTDSSSASRSPTVSSQPRSSNTNFFSASLDPPQFFICLFLILFLSLFFRYLFGNPCMCWLISIRSLVLILCVYLLEWFDDFWFLSFWSLCGLVGLIWSAMFLRGWFLDLLLNSGFLLFLYAGCGMLDRVFVIFLVTW